jgi:hypothetical protein
MKKLILVFISVISIFNCSYSQDLRSEDTWRVPVLLGSQTVVEANDSLFVALRVCRLRVPKGIGEISLSRKCNLILVDKKASDIEYSVMVFGWPNGIELEVYARWSSKLRLVSEVRSAVLKDLATHCWASK